MESESPKTIHTSMNYSSTEWVMNWWRQRGCFEHQMKHDSVIAIHSTIKHVYFWALTESWIVDLRFMAIWILRTVNHDSFESDSWQSVCFELALKSCVFLKKERKNEHESLKLIPFFFFFFFLHEMNRNQKKRLSFFVRKNLIEKKPLIVAWPSVTQFYTRNVKYKISLSAMTTSLYICSTPMLIHCFSSCALLLSRRIRRFETNSRCLRRTTDTIRSDSKGKRVSSTHTAFLFMSLFTFVIEVLFTETNARLSPTSCHMHKDNTLLQCFKAPLDPVILLSGDDGSLLQDATTVAGLFLFVLFFCPVMWEEFQCIKSCRHRYEGFR